MDIDTIKQSFVDELDTIRQTPSPKSRKYSKPLKSAILKLCEQGYSTKQIRQELGISGAAFDNWRQKPQKSPKATFAPLNIKPATASVQSSTLPRRDLTIELAAGLTIKMTY